MYFIETDSFMLLTLVFLFFSGGLGFVSFIVFIVSVCMYIINTNFLKLAVKKCSIINITFTKYKTKVCLPQLLKFQPEMGIIKN